MTWDFRTRELALDESVFTVEELPYLEAEKLDPAERAAIERAVIQRERLITDLQRGVLELRSERDTLEDRLSRLESERSELRDRIDELRTERPAIEPKQLFSSLESAFDGLDEDIGHRGVSIGDIDVTLKANVTQSDGDVRFHLPSLDERSATEHLSQLSFTIRSDASDQSDDPGYTDIPDLVGTSHDVAARRLTAAGFDVGEITVVDDPRLAVGTIVDQFPEPLAVAPPGSPIDLTVVGETNGGGESESDASETTEDRPRGGDEDPETPVERDDGPAVDEEIDLLSAFKRAVERGRLDPETEFAARLRDIGVDDLDGVAERSPEELADALGLSPEPIEPLAERLEKERRDELPVDSIDGIGPTYAGRLDDAGVRSVDEFVRLDPEAIARITKASEGRAEGWLEQAKRLVA
jgi:predicted flap endonuclease-1-like 5' DNA nuclease